MENDNYIWVTSRFIGFHQYPAAPKEVEFLREKHRHVFHVKVYIEVFHNDRDVEFFMFQKFVNTLLPEDGTDLKATSCEMIADDLADEIQAEYPERDLFIEVSEDGENGCFKSY